MKINKQFSLILFFLFSFFLNFSCKNEITSFIEVTNSDLVINMACEGRYWEKCYPGLDVRFSPYTSDFPETDPNVIYEWDLGDGSTSSEILPHHEYETPGTYLIKVKATFEEFQYLAERTIEIGISPTIIENETQDGIFISQTSDGVYSILCEKDNNKNAVIRYQDGNILSKVDLPNGFSINTEISAIHQSNGNIQFVEGTSLIEMKPNGEVILDKYIYPDITSLYKSLNGFSSTHELSWVGDEPFDAQLRKFDNGGNLLDDNNLSPVIENYYVEGVTQSAADSFFVVYLEKNSTPFRKSILQRIDFEGNEIWQKVYEFFIGSRIHKLSDGYIAYASYSPDSHFFTKIDFDGNEIWRKEIPVETENKNFSFFEEGNDLIVFFDNMRGLRISSDGLSIEWENTFGYPPDVFRYAIRNTNGNFALIGNQDDYFSNGFKPTILVEVNSDGELIE